MKIFDIDSFIAERMKFRPVTNVEWDKIRKETLVELPVKYENILTLGNVLTIKKTYKHKERSNENSETDYIVTLKEYAPVEIARDAKQVLVSYRLNGNTNQITYWVDFFDNFKPAFPKLDILGVCEFEVTNIRGTLPDYILRKMKDINYMKRVYDEYHLACDCS